MNLAPDNYDIVDWILKNPNDFNLFQDMAYQTCLDGTQYNFTEEVLTLILQKLQSS